LRCGLLHQLLPKRRQLVFAQTIDCSRVLFQLFRDVDVIEEHTGQLPYELLMRRSRINITLLLTKCGKRESLAEISERHTIHIIDSCQGDLLFEAIRSGLRKIS
jgi:hypothetical protein